VVRGQDQAEAAAGPAVAVPVHSRLPWRVVPAAQVRALVLARARVLARRPVPVPVRVRVPAVAALPVLRPLLRLPTALL
jgi:hypothetical protein